MVADASIWRLCGSNRKSMEVGGSEWVEGITKSWKFPLNPWKFSLLRGKLQLLRWKVPSTCTKQNPFMKKVVLRFVKLAKIVWRHGGVLSRTMFFFLGQNTRKVHVHKFGKKTGQSTRYRKIRAKVCQLSRVARVACMCNTTIYTWEGEPEVIS